jgi:hypothetical protein
MIKPVLFTVMTTSYLCLGCSSIEQFTSSDTVAETATEQVMKSEHFESADLTWLEYVDPKADANIAIQKGDFRLFAFTGRARTFPGLEDDVEDIQRQCGYQLLANSSDGLNVETALSGRKKLYQYAATYNQLVFDACFKKPINDTQDY